MSVVDLDKSFGLLNAKPNLWRRFVELDRDPRVAALLLIPTWLAAPAKLRPGVLIDEYIKLHDLEPALRRALLV